MENTSDKTSFTTKNKDSCILRELSDSVAWVIKEDFTGKKTYYNRNNDTSWTESQDESGNKTFIQIDTHKQSFKSLPHFDNSDLTNLKEDNSKRSTFKNDEDYSSFSSSSDEDCTKKEKQANRQDSQKFIFRRKSKRESEHNKLTSSTSSNGKLNWNSISKDQISGPIDNKLTSEKKTFIHRARYSENGKIGSKKWNTAFLVLLGPQIFIYRDQKSSTPKPNAPNGKPETTMNVSDVIVSKATTDYTSKENTLTVENIGAPGSSVIYLLKFATPVECQSWEYALKFSQEFDMEKRFTDNRISTCIPSTDQGSLVNFLKDFFRARVSREQLVARGIIKNEPVFGSTIHEICEHENTDVPTFVTRIIMAIELRGLKSSGIYRMSGNSAKIQALRMEVDQYKYNLNSEQWDFDVLTGALKLFFRELRQPLFNNSTFMDVSECMKKENIDFGKIREILRSMPKYYLKTATVLFHHLFRIIQDPDNKMTSGNLAIVFGPNLLHDDEILNKENAYYLIGKKNFFIEFLITKTPEIFGDPVPPSITTCRPDI